MMYERQLAVCVSTPIESMIPELELSLGVLVTSRSNGVRDAQPYRGDSDCMTAVLSERAWCDSDCINQERGRTLQMRFRLDHYNAGNHSGERLNLTDAIQIMNHRGGLSYLGPRKKGHMQQSTVAEGPN